MGRESKKNYFERVHNFVIGIYCGEKGIKAELWVAGPGNGGEVGANAAGGRILRGSIVIIERHIRLDQRRLGKGDQTK